MLWATKVFTASSTVASSLMQKSILLYPLNSAASPAVKAVPTVLNARGAVEHWDILRAAAGIRRNIVVFVRSIVCIKYCVNNYFWSILDSTIESQIYTKEIARFWHPWKKFYWIFHSLTWCVTPCVPVFVIDSDGCASICELMFFSKGITSMKVKNIDDFDSPTRFWCFRAPC